MPKAEAKAPIMHNYLELDTEDAESLVVRIILAKRLLRNLLIAKSRCLTMLVAASDCKYKEIFLLWFPFL